MTEPRRAFVAGATGYTGREVVSECLRVGVEVVAHVRPDSRALARWRERFERLGAVVDTTAWTVEAMTSTLRAQRANLVFSLIGTTRARRRRAGAGVDLSYTAIDFGLTKLLIDAAMAAGTRPRFVYLSALGVGFGARGEYFAARARAEQALRASGLEFVIARPSLITGSDRDEHRPAERWGAAIADVGLSLVGVFGGARLDARYRSTTNVALARALVRLALDPTATGVFEAEQLR